MSEMWFRGEGVGVKPATPGSTASHDIGDGVYLTDNQASAEAYARLRAPDPKEQRVYQVPIDRSKLRVLDLTTDARWQKTLQIVEPHIKSANENYGRTFEGFLKANKINLDDFDVVIGRDYVRGGKQMVVLYKNGKPTELHVRIRNSFQPVQTPGGSSSSLAIKGKMPGRVGSGLRAIGGMAALIGLELLAAWLFNKMEKRLIETQMTALEPKIKELIKERAAAIAKLQAEHKKAYAVITVEVSSRIVSMGGSPMQQSFGVLRLMHVDIGPEIVSTRNWHNGSDFGGPVTLWRYTYSVEVALAQDEVDLFVALYLEHAYYESMLMVFPGNSVVTAELDKVRQRITASFGPRASSDLWNAYMWPKFKYKSNY